MNINGTCVKFCPSLRNLGVTLDCTVSLHQHILNICRNAFLELRRINSKRNFLTTDAVTTLVCSLVLSRIDNCNFLLTGLPQYHLKKIQYVQNSVAKMIFQAQKSDHVSSPLEVSLVTHQLQNRVQNLFIVLQLWNYLELGHNTYQT